MQPFSDGHQPSLKIRRREENLSRDVALGSRDTRATEAEQNKLTRSKFILGVVKCKDYMKPRCLYSVTSPSRMKPAAVNGAPEPLVTRLATTKRLNQELATPQRPKPKFNDYVTTMRVLTSTAQYSVNNSTLF